MSQKLHVKTGDTVVVISGKDKGKQGKIKAAMPKDGRVVVEGINMIKRHTNRPRLIQRAELLKKKLRFTLPKLCFWIRKQRNRPA